MGCCAGTTAGSRKRLPEVSWHCGLSCHGLEVEGIPLDRYLDHFTGLNLHEQHEVIGRVVQEADQSPSSSAGVCSRKVARVGLLSWNVGGISDHRKDQGAGLEEAAQAAVADVLHAAVAKIGAADIIVVGLQEIISLTPSNAMKGTSSFNESRKNQSFYGWPETVAQWVEVLLGGLNSGPMPSGPAGKSFCSDHRSYVLYGQPVYLFGLLLCVFCPAYLLKHIRDFGMAEKPMDSRIKSGRCQGCCCLPLRALGSKLLLSQLSPGGDHLKFCKDQCPRSSTKVAATGTVLDRDQIQVAREPDGLSCVCPSRNFPSGGHQHEIGAQE